MTTDFQRLANQPTGYFRFLPRHRSSFNTVYKMNLSDARNIFFLRVQTSDHNFCGIVLPLEKYKEKNKWLNKNKAWNRKHFCYFFPTLHTKLIPEPLSERNWSKVNDPRSLPPYRLTEFGRLPAFVRFRSHTHRPGVLPLVAGLNFRFRHYRNVRTVCRVCIVCMLRDEWTWKYDVEGGGVGRK
jgi:hypothetical protein